MLREHGSFWKTCLQTQVAEAATKLHQIAHEDFVLYVLDPGVSFHGC